MSKDHGHYTNELEHDATYRTKRVRSFRDAGDGTLVPEISEDTLLSIEIDSGDNLVSYMGLAAPGTPTSAAAWQVLKIDENGGGLQITYADGDTEFDNVFDNRESLSYS